MARPLLGEAIVVFLEACLLALLAGAFGCSGKTAVTGASVSGVVRYRGKPVPGGVIRLWSARQDGNHSAQGTIKDDGSYEVPNAPLGLCKVVVDTEAVKHNLDALMKTTPESVRRAHGQGRPRQPEAAPAKYVSLDPKYRDLKTTPLEITIEKGRQIRNIELP